MAQLPSTARWTRCIYLKTKSAGCVCELRPKSAKDPDIFERDLEKYIDWYNNVRIKRRLDGSSPVEYRLSRAA